MVGREPRSIDEGLDRAGVTESEAMSKNWISIDQTSVGEAVQLCQPGHFVRLSHEQIPRFVPDSLTAKCPGAVLMASGIAPDKAVYVLNLVRHDGANLDETPIVFVAGINSLGVSGFVYQHGSWDGRTSPVPSDMATLIAASGMLAAGAFKSPAASGAFTDLADSSHARAFDAAAKRYFNQQGGWPV